MFYRVKNGEAEHFTEPENLDAQFVTAGCISLSEFAGMDFPESCVQACRATDNRYHSNFEVYDSFSYGILYALDLKNPRRERSRAAVVLRKNLLLVVLLEDRGGLIFRAFSHAVEIAESSFCLERVLSSFLGQVIAGSNDIMADCEQAVIRMEESLLDNEIGENLNKKIYSMKNDMILRKSYYEELIDLCEAVQEDENGLFAQDENFRHLKVFSDKLLRLSGNVQLLCENLIHVREAYQSALDYRLNNIMKIFTVVTTIFLPLSLIAGWYGMNFSGMPELQWSFGYPLVIAISLAVAGLCIWYFKRKKLL